VSRGSVAGAAALLCALSSCSGPLPPSSSIVGDWAVRLAPAHFAYVNLRFEQTGSVISGTACMQDDVHLIYSRVPLFVDYPDVSFAVTPEQTAPCCANFAGTSFHGRFNTDGSLTAYESHDPGHALTGSRSPGSGQCELAR
jgi:hypothetical protein